MKLSINEFPANELFRQIDSLKAEINRRAQAAKGTIPNAYVRNIPCLNPDVQARIIMETGALLDKWARGETSHLTGYFKAEIALAVASILERAGVEKPTAHAEWFASEVAGKL